MLPGMMPFAGLGASGTDGPGGEFVGSSHSSGTAFAGWPTGSVEGDLALIWKATFGGYFSTAGWNNINVASATNCAGTLSWKVVTASDLAGTPSPGYSVGNNSCYVFRGATSVALKTTSTSNSPTLAGFTKDAASLFVLSLMGTRNQISNVPTPTGWNDMGRGITSASHITEGAYKASADYANSETSTWTPTTGGQGGTVSAHVELT